MAPVPILPIKLLSSARPLPAHRRVSPIHMARYLEYTQNKFNELICCDSLFSEHIEVMQKRGIKAVVFGGWVRDRLHEIVNSVDHPSNDIDMVASGSSSIVDILGDHATPTVFGGAGRMESTIYFDAWDLPNTFHIKRYSLSLTFETLPTTADYTINSIIFKPAQLFDRPEIFEIGAISAVEDKIVEFQSNTVILPKIQAARAVNLAAKLDFDLSATVKQFIREICGDKETLDEVLVGLEKYCSTSIASVAKKKLAEALYN